MHYIDDGNKLIIEFTAYFGINMNSDDHRRMIVFHSRAKEVPNDLLLLYHFGDSYLPLIFHDAVIIHSFDSDTVIIYVYPEYVWRRVLSGKSSIHNLCR